MRLGRGRTRATRGLIEELLRLQFLSGLTQVPSEVHVLRGKVVGL